MEAVVPNSVPDFTQLAEQLTKLSEFFQSIEDKTKVYANDIDGAKAKKLVQATDTVRAKKEKKLEKIQYQERLQDAKDEYRIQKQIASKEYQINRKLKGDVTFEKIHYMRDAFKQSRTHRNLISAAFSAFFTGFSLGRKQTQINRYKKQIALLAAKEEYRQAQKRTLETYIQKQKALREEHKAFLKKPDPQKTKDEKERQKILKNIDSRPFDLKEALDIGIIPRYGTKEYKSLPQERKDALKLATKKCMKPENSNPQKVSFKDFKAMVDHYEEMILVSRYSKIPVKTTPKQQRVQKKKVNPNPDPQKTRPRTR